MAESLYEDIHNPYSQRAWWNTIQVIDSTTVKISYYERALGFIPGSYKLWFNYIKDVREHVSHTQTPTNYETINRLYSRALRYMSLMPKIWLDYCELLAEQGFVSKTRQMYDYALQQLPVSQHDLVWEQFLQWVKSTRLPETARRVYRRYLQFNPGFLSQYISFLDEAGYYQEAVDRLLGELKESPMPEFYSKLASIVSSHPNEVENSEYILLDCLEHLPQDSKSWQTLAELYIRRGNFNQARSTFQQGLDSVESLSDFGILFGAYSSFEEEILASLVEAQAEKEVIEEAMASLEQLLASRDMILSDVKLRQNPNDVQAWLSRAALFEEDPSEGLRIYAQAVTVVDSMRAIGPYHLLWIHFARVYEENDDFTSARLVLYKAAQSKFRLSEHLSRVVLEWAELEISQSHLSDAFRIVEHFCKADRKTVNIGQDV